MTCDGIGEDFPGPGARIRLSDYDQSGGFVLTMSFEVIQYCECGSWSVGVLDAARIAQDAPN